PPLRPSFPTRRSSDLWRSVSGGHRFLPWAGEAPRAGRITHRRGGQSRGDVDVPVEGVIRARRPTERRPNPLGITPSNDDVFTDQDRKSTRLNSSHVSI